MVDVLTTIFKAPESNLLDCLTQLGDVVERNISSLNSGGCCVFAATVVERLQARGIPAYGMVVTYEPSISLDEARRANNAARLKDPKAWNAQGVYFTHVQVMFTWRGKIYSYDSKHLKPGRVALPTCGVLKPYDGELDAEELRALADDHTAWNKVFDREQIPEIEIIADQYLC